MPERVQRRRTRGWRMPDGAMYVGRPSRWGNPFTVSSNRTSVFIHDGYRVWWETPRSVDAFSRARAQAVHLYAIHTGPRGSYELDTADLRCALAGRDLACWCPLDQPCHADVLLELANGGGV